MSRLALFVVVLSTFAIQASAQPADPNFPVTNGPVYALEQQNGTLYVGGQFTQISPASGAGVPFDPTTGAQVVGFPKVVGRIFVVAQDIAGGWYIGGIFTSVGGQPRSNLARINPDMSVSPWNPVANDAVYSIAQSVSGTVFVGGLFTTITGQSRSRIAEIDVNGNATAWNPGANSVVRTLIVTGGTVYAGGDFSFIGGVPRSCLAAISSTTGVVSGTWNPAPNGNVFTMEVVARPGPTVSWLVGGAFTTIGGQSRTYLAEINTAGTATAWNPAPNGIVYDIQEHTNVYVGGAFTTVGGQPRNHIASLSTTTGLATAWNPNADDAVYTLVWSLNHVLIGGKFTTVNGLPRPHLARIDETTGVPDAFNPGPSDIVQSLAIGNVPGVTAAVYVGGEFSGMAGFPRNNLAAIDIATGTVLEWAPEPNGPVYALKARVDYPGRYKLWAAGAFTAIGGQARGRVAELDPESGAPTVFDPHILDNAVLTFAIQDSVLYAGGTFSATSAGPHPWASAFDIRTGAYLAWDPFPNNAVLAMGITQGKIYMGGLFTSFNFSATHAYFSGFQLYNGINGAFGPSVSAPVRAIYANNSTVWFGGDFVTAGGQPRNRIAAMTPGLNTVTAFNPGADGIVRALAPNGSEVIAGGDFATFGGQPRPRLATFDAASGTLSPAVSGVADREVFTALGLGQAVAIGGSFHGVYDVPQAQVAVLGTQPVQCALSGTSDAPLFARKIRTGDFDNDGIKDLLVCGPNTVWLMRGNGSGGLGDGTFSLAQILPATARPTDAAFADFDADGNPDVVIASTTMDGGSFRVMKNYGGFFGGVGDFPLFGAVDGIAVADMNQDGILDVAACLGDSAGNELYGGVELMRGTGSGGIWNGGFAPSPGNDAYIVFSSSFGRRVLLEDFNNDGTLDAVWGPNGAPASWFDPGGVFVCGNLGGTRTTSSGYGLASGDLNGDGLRDVVSAGGRRIFVRLKNGSLNPACAGSPWFTAAPAITLPSTPRDHVLLDWDQDGKLDIVYTLDSLQTVEWLPGNGDGTFGASQFIAAMDAWDLAAGDFNGDGRPDVVVSERNCGKVAVISNGGSPLLGGGLQLVTPNGGEVWSVVFPALTPSSAEAPIAEDDAPGATVESAPPAPVLANAHQVTWTKGPGVQAVDVSVSRNGGSTWQSVATNVPGTAMNWYPTPPASADTRIRVMDSVVSSRSDASDGSFQITNGAVGVDGDLPLKVAFAVTGANPAAGRTRFRLELPHAADVDVQALDVRGRVVRDLAHGRFPAGRHDLAWNAVDDRGAAARSGVYFVRARIGEFTQVRKIVLVR